MEYFLTGIAGTAIFFLIILLINNRRQGIKIKKSIEQIKDLKTDSRNNLRFFD